MKMKIWICTDKEIETESECCKHGKRYNLCCQECEFKTTCKDACDYALGWGCIATEEIEVECE